MALSLHCVSFPPEVTTFIYLSRSMSRHCAYIQLLRQGNLAFAGRTRRDEGEWEGDLKKSWGRD